MKPIGRLHVLTDTVFQTRFSHVDLTRLAIAGGADAIQYRQKAGTTREMIETAAAMKAMCAEAGAVLIVNDRVDVALAAGADGVHLGQQDFPIAKARDLLGDGVLIGGTAKTLDQARQCFAEGADYVGFGPIFETGSKGDAGRVKGIEELRLLVEALGKPVIAIGGIDTAGAKAVVASGAHGIAVLSAVCCQDDPAEATRKLRMQIDDA